MGRRYVDMLTGASRILVNARDGEQKPVRKLLSTSGGAAKPQVRACLWRSDPAPCNNVAHGLCTPSPACSTLPTGFSTGACGRRALHARWFCVLSRSDGLVARVFDRFGGCGGKDAEGRPRCNGAARVPLHPADKGEHQTWCRKTPKRTTPGPRNLATG
jgi:hypothetical protein